MLRYPGGKTRAIKSLIKILREENLDLVDKTVYSPFYGGGSFENYLLGYGLATKVIANDLFKPLYNFWKCLKADPRMLRLQVTRIHPITKEQFKSIQKKLNVYANTNTNTKIKTTNVDPNNTNTNTDTKTTTKANTDTKTTTNTDTDTNNTDTDTKTTTNTDTDTKAKTTTKINTDNTDYEYAAMYFAVNRSSFSGSTLSGGYSKEAASKRFTTSSIDRLLTYDLSKTEFQNCDFEIFINSIPDGEFMFLDPPYHIDSKLYGSKGDLHAGFDHVKLFNLLKNRTNWMLTYNDDDYILDMYEQITDAVIYEAEWSYGMNKSKKSKEIVIVRK